MLSTQSSAFLIADCIRNPEHVSTYFSIAASLGHKLRARIHPKTPELNLHKWFVGEKNRAALHTVITSSRCNKPLTQRGYYEVERGSLAAKENNMSILLILVILLLVFGFGGYRLGPGLGYYGGGGISLIILIVIILLLLKVI